ncbi:MAG: PmoA family protein [Bacteroidetes bacterium]|nr:PmoA family protein [Bacteroidota bacterium]
MKKIFSVILVLTMIVSFAMAQPKIKLVTKASEKKVDVLIGGELFTSYIYPDNIKKPVLWPVISDGGNEITRQFPLKNKAGERADHPHHVGIWLNYGDVNGLDFWNNSEAIPADRADKYGTIYHETIESVKSGKGEATLLTTASWKDIKGNKLLKEISEYTFSVDGKTRIIDRTTMLKAENGKVDITDNKEGMFAIRLTRELELPSRGKVKLTDSHGVVTEVDGSDDKTATGNYLSSEGIEGDAVWATRGKWMKLYGEINGEKVAVVIFDHPGNAGYPTYWHARGYGLFAANTLGQKVFSKGKEEMNLSVEKGETVTFRYRLAVFSGEPTVEEINKMSKDFESKI